MNISGASAYIKTSAVQIARSPRTANLLRTAKSTVPFIATGAAGALLYNTSPEFKCMVDQTRETLASHPRISEMISSGIFLGVIPDFLTQRYEGNGMNFRRLASMTALGSFNGGVLTRGLYTVLSYLIPGESFWENEAKIGIDQFLWCPAFYLYYFSVVNPIEGKPMESFAAIKTNIKNPSLFAGPIGDCSEHNWFTICLMTCAYSPPTSLAYYGSASCPIWRTNRQNKIT